MDSNASNNLEDTTEIHSPAVQSPYVELLIQAIGLSDLISASSEDDTETIVIHTSNYLGELEQQAIESDDSALELLINATLLVGQQLYSKFQENSDTQYLDLVIGCEAEVVRLTPEDSPILPNRLFNLGVSYQDRFEYLGELDDIEWAIEYTARAVSLTPESHEEMPSRLNNLGGAYQRRFERLGDLEDINKAIECNARALLLTPEDHANIPICLNQLGSAHHTRFERLGNLEDINNAIQYSERAVSLASEGHAFMPSWLNNLGNAHQSRFERHGNLEDIDKAIECNARAVSLTPGGNANMPMRLSNLGNAYQTRFERLDILEDIDKAVEYKTFAVTLTPENHASLPNRLYNLGGAHQRRFERFSNLVDIDKSIECFTRAVALTPDGHGNLALQLMNLGNAHRLRFERLDHLGDIDKAIEYSDRGVSLTPEDHADIPSRLNCIGNAHQRRFERFTKKADIDKAIEYKARAVSLTPEDHSDMPTWLSSLGSAHQSRFERLGHLEDIDKAIEYKARAVSLMPESHVFMPGWLNNLGNAYSRRFEGLDRLEDIDKAIEFQARAVSLTPKGHAEMPSLLNNLGYAHRIRYARQSNPQNIESALSCFRESALSSAGDPHIKFKAASNWAQIASAQAISEQLLAYQTVMDLMPHIVWLGGTIAQRYTDVRFIGDQALEAAAAAISAQEYTLALEWLEQGRSIVWNQTLQLRTPFDDLSHFHPELAENLRRIANQLHSASTQSLHLDTPLRDVPSLEQAAQQHRRLAKEYEGLVRQIRTLPGFEGFLLPKKTAELLPAAQIGPVVLINVHKSRSDALVLLPGKTEVQHLPLPGLSYVKATDARKELERSLQYLGLRERQTTRRPFPQTIPQSPNTLKGVLTTLWSAVAKPVLDFLGYTQQPGSSHLPHITWCTTGPLSFLPLHASGCYDQPGTKLPDYVISSYTPTLSALITAGSFVSPKHSRVLAIGQEATPGQSRLPGTKAELSAIAKHAQPPLQYTQIAGHDATTTGVLAAMEEHEWVHLACHAHQNRNEPIESGFFLHDGTLSLASIAQKSFKHKGLAFLSACQTARGDENLADEAVHLASGMLMAGYPSIIATMWSVKDEDAPVVADQVYGQLLKDGKMDYKDAAKALHEAVGALRAKVGENEFGRWVPYIHMGV